MSCSACSDRAAPEAAGSHIERIAELYMDSHQGAYLAACKACGGRFVEVWREVCAYGFEDLWAYWAPITQDDEIIIVERFSSDPGDGMRAAFDFIETREHLVHDIGLGRHYWSNDASEVGLAPRAVPPRGDLRARIGAAPQARLRVHVVVHEDHYETVFGDGYYGYHVRAFYDEANARAFARVKSKTGTEHDLYHVLSTELFLREERIEMAPMGSRHDRVSVAEVVADLERSGG